MALFALQRYGPDDWDESDELPTQLACWMPWHWSGGEADPGCGEWLRGLKATKRGTRQLVFQDGEVRGLVTFGEWVRKCETWYEGWGSITRLSRPVTRQMLLRDPRTRARFDADGIHALQGLPIRLKPAEAVAISELADGLDPTVIPEDEPDYSDEPVYWVGQHGLAPECYIEAAVAATPRLWRELGFAAAPERQVWLGDAGRADLLYGNVVGEAKRAVTLHNGAIEQLERYLDHLHRRYGRSRQSLKGVLLQCAENTSDAVIERLEASDYLLELWSVFDNGDWGLEQLA